MISDYYLAIHFGIESAPFYFWATLGYSIGTGSLIPILFLLEKYMTPTKGIFTIISFVIFGFAVVAVFGVIDKHLAQYIVYAGLLADIICIFGLYIYVIQTSEGSIRGKAVNVMIGLVVLIAGMILDTQAAEFLTPAGGLLNQIRLLIASSLMMLGVIIFTWTQLKE